MKRSRRGDAVTEWDTSFTPPFKSVLHRAQRNLLIHRTFAAGTSTQLDEARVQQAEVSFRNKVPSTEWTVVGQGVRKNTFVDHLFLLTDNVARFSNVWRQLFASQGQHAPSALASVQTAVQSAIEEVSQSPQAALRLKPYLLSKVPGMNMSWHVDDDARETLPQTASANLVCYVVLGPPQSINCVVVFAHKAPCKRAMLHGLSDTTMVAHDNLLALHARFKADPSRRYDANGFLRLVPLQWPSELEGQGACAYSMWVSQGDMLVFDGSALHGVYNFDAQRVLAFNASTSGLIEPPLTMPKPSPTQRRCDQRMWQGDAPRAPSGG